MRTIPDWDDVALGLASAGPSMPTVAADLVPYAFSLQNSDGGWASYARDADPSLAYVRTIKWTDKGRIFWDPSLPDITGHMLLGLGRLGYRATDPRIAQALDYLRRVQFENGMWYGYFGVAYVYGTSQVLLGLEAIDADRHAPEVVRAVRWLKAQQQPDGCWAEDVAALSAPEHAGRGGRCTSVQTSWGLLGLLAAGEPADSPAVRGAAGWLLDHQRADGGWDMDRVDWAYIVQYSLQQDGISWPLWALAKYRHAQRDHDGWDRWRP
jgi:squalene-hopene/tetraprenyl-beta-curcumene cyclase